MVPSVTSQGETSAPSKWFFILPIIPSSGMSDQASIKIAIAMIAEEVMEVAGVFQEFADSSSQTRPVAYELL